MAVTHYRQLIAWQKAIDLTESVYACSRQFPRDELYGLTNQIRRCAVSIPSNIAEGQGRGSPKEFRHFLRIAAGSLQECETQLLIASRLRYLADDSLDELLSQTAEIGRILNGLIRSLLTTDH